jgi:hypothetical protein
VAGIGMGLLKMIMPTLESGSDLRKEFEERNVNVKVTSLKHQKIL